jgi:uncharacterized protein
MQKFIPIFPLNLVAYPGEQINLHVFEPRYKQLINECNAEGKRFGIPVVDSNTMLDHGTEMELLSIQKIYPEGEMDIKIRGVEVFQLLELVKDVPEKLYAGAIVATVQNIQDHHSKLYAEFEALTAQLFNLLDIAKDIYKPDFILNSFNLGHYVGFDFKDEFDLLRHPRETSRQKLIVEHIKKILPSVQQINEIKERAKLNGQFRMINPPDSWRL